MGSGRMSNDDDSKGEEEEEEEEDDDDDASAGYHSPGSSPTASASVPRTMTTVSRHYFGGDSSADDHVFFIDIIENMREDYGMFVWPCSRVLAEYIWQQRSRFLGVSVLELGAGTSLPGLVAAKVGANVILTDNSYRAEVLDNMKRICDLNELNCEIMGLTWGEWDEPMFNLLSQIVLGADVLYNSSDFDDLFSTVAFLLEKSPGSVFMTAYHYRRFFASRRVAKFHMEVGEPLSSCMHAVIWIWRMISMVGNDQLLTSSLKALKGHHLIGQFFPFNHTISRNHSPK